MTETSTIVRKAIGYITHEKRVLFFRAEECPELGAELPGGTLEPNESVEDGLARELAEETGLTAFGPAHFLGMTVFEADDGRNEVQHRHFYHVPLEETAPAQWSRVVEEGNGTFTFLFFWAPVGAPPDEIYPGHDAFLADVAARVFASS